MPNDQYEKNKNTTVNNLDEVTLKDTIPLMCSADYK